MEARIRAPQSGTGRKLRPGLRRAKGARLHPGYKSFNSRCQTAHFVLAARYARALPLSPPSLKLRRASPPRGADGAPRGAPGVEPHAYRVAWGALARRRSNPAPRDDRLLALQPWRLFLPGSLPPPIGFGGRRPLSACQGAWPAGARIPRGAVTSRSGGDATILLRLRDRLRRRPSNEQN